MSDIIEDRMWDTRTRRYIDPKDIFRVFIARDFKREYSVPEDWVEFSGNYFRVLEQARIGQNIYALWYAEGMCYENEHDLWSVGGQRGYEGRLAGFVVSPHDELETSNELMNEVFMWEQKVFIDQVEVEVVAGESWDNGNDWHREDVAVWLEHIAGRIRDGYEDEGCGWRIIRRMDKYMEEKGE